MDVHTVLVQLHDPATIDQCTAAMESMAGRIDGMVDLVVRRNELDGTYAHDLALTTTWRDRAAYRDYEENPVHLEVRTLVLELMAGAATIHYTVDSS